jgi:hypothetical protein
MPILIEDPHVRTGEKTLRGFWILAVIAATGCGHGGAAPNSAKVQPSAHQGDAVATVAPSEAECRDYAQAVVKAVTTGDLATLNNLIDWEAIFQTMATGLEMSDSYRAGVFKGMRNAITDPERGFCGQLIKNLKKGGKFSFLRVRQSHGRQVVLFRMLLEGDQGGLNYFEFAPRRYPGGQVRAVDVYTYLSGELISETLRRALLPMVAEESRSILDKLIAGERDYVHDFPDIGRAATLVTQGKGVEALAIYNKMRPETRRQKVVLLGRLSAAQVAGDDNEYAQTIEEFRKFYPNDAGLDLVSIDGFVMRKDIDGAVKAIGRLDQALGGDSYLDTMCAGVCESNGDLEGTRRFARRAVERDPTQVSGYWAVVAYSLKAKDYDETLAYLKAIDQKFSMNFKDLTKAPLYAGFVKSPQYSQWLDYLKAKKQAPTGKSSQKGAADPESVKKESP